jgi:hypothetical protein
MALLTMTQQKLLISMLNRPVSSKDRKFYRHVVNFYEAVWKFRDMGLATNTVIDANGRKRKLWKLTLDGVIVARVLSKEI